MIKRIKKPISQRLCESLDIPCGTLGRTSFLEAVGNREVTVGGCLYLKTYRDDLVVLELCDGVISVSGRELELKSFSNGDISVSGIISRICYGEEPGDQNDS